MPGKQCFVDGCDRKVYARQLCEPHYRRHQRTGDVAEHRRIGEKPVQPPCSVEGCNELATERGWCHSHYLRWVRLGELRPERPVSRQVNFDCDVDGCERPAEIQGLCRTHANRKRKWGDVQAEKPIRELVGRNKNHGYWRVSVPPDLRFLTNGRTSEAEHRLEMAKLLGRPLHADESVHHINGDRTDNRTDGPLVDFRSGNLELWSRWQPSGQRVEDKIDFAIEILERYLPGALALQLPLNMPAVGSSSKL